MEDLRDLAENGLTDLFEYGQDFMVGNALGDGSKKDDNSTSGSARARVETFAEKYRKELKKDLDDLGLDEEEDETQGNETAEATEGETNEEDSGMIDLDELTKSDEDIEEELQEVEADKVEL